jgi:hypothetical protein
MKLVVSGQWLVVSVEEPGIRGKGLGIRDWKFEISDLLATSH